MLLTDAFEKFRNNSLKNYGLCPSHYFSAPTLNWNAMHHMTKIGLELISDAGMYLIFEKSMRIGDFYISKRYSKANNKYLTSYDSKQESNYIICLDANNPYGFFQQADSNG